MDEGFINELPEYVLGEVFNAIYRKANAIPDDKTWEDRKAEAWESIWEGIIVGAVYGTFEVPAAMKQNKALSMQLRREANSSMSWTEFVEKTSDIRPENIEQEVYDKAREQIYKASVEQKADVMKKAFSGSVYESESIAREELYSTVDSMGVEQSKVLPDGSVYRTESKDLYSEVNQDSAGTYTVAYGDRNTGAVYGTVSVRTDGNVQTITGVRVRHGYENIRTEMVRDAIAQTRSTESDVQWNPTTPGLQSVKDTLVETNPRGKDYGLNFEAKAVGEDSDIKAMALEIRNNATNLTEQEALVSARLQAITGSGFKVDSVDNITQEQLAGRTDRNFNAATSQAKSLIYLGQQSNVSSFTHELFHAVTSVRQNESAELSSAIRETLNDETRKAQFTSFINDHKEIWEKANDDSSVDEIMARFEQIAGNESTWSPKIEEDLARLWEAYVSSPNSVKNSIPGRIKILLQKLADLMKQVYRTLRNGVALDPEIARAYNKLMNLEEDNKAENTGNTAKPADTVMTQDSRKKLQDRVTGDRLLYAQDLIDEVKSVGGEVDENGYIHVFHRTSKEAADRIRSTNRMIAKEDGLFFSTKPDGQIVGYGDEVVDFWIPAERLLLDDIFSDEVHLRFPLSNRNIITTMMFQDNDGSTTVQKKNGSLVIVHSMSEGKLRGVIDVGGMPMPSLAITAPKAEVLEPTLNYGEITFIGNSKLAGRVIGSGAVWDRDIWSPTYPQAQYKMNKKGISNELRAIQSNYSKMFDWPHIADEDSWMEYQYATPEDLILKLKDPKRYPAIALQFLSENGKTVDIPHVPEAHELYSARTLMAARQWLETNKYLTDSNWSELYDSLSLGSDIINAYPSADLPSATSRFFSRQEKYQKRMEYINKIKNDPDLGFDRSYDTVSAIVQASSRSSNAIDYYALGNILEEAINKSEFQTWLERKFNRFYSEPMLKIGNTWKPYNLENIVKYMEKQGVVGATSTGFSTDGELAAISAKNLKTREEIRENEDRIYSEPAYRDRISEASDALFNAVSNSKTEGSNVFIETDNVRAVIAEYLQKRKTTKADMKSLLWGAYAKSDSIIDAAYELAELLKAPPQKYFEAKPALVLRASDFDTVLVPEGISGELVEYLSNSGLNVIKYGSGKQLETFIDTVTTNESLMFQDNDTYNPDEVIENMDSVEDQESMESVSDDWIVEEVEIMNDGHSFSMEYPEDWDDVPDFDDDAVDQEQKLQAETPKTPSKYLKNTDNTDMTFEQFAKENAPQVVYEGNEEQKDQQFREAIQDETNLRGYLGIIGEALLVDTPSVNAYYEQQFNKTYKRYQDALMVEPFIDEKYRLGLQSRVSRQVNDADVRRAAKYSVEGKDFPVTTGLAEKVRKELSDNARFYRNILAPLIGDKSMLPDTLIEADTKLDLPGRSDMDLMAVSELADIASKYASQAVADKIMDGSLKFGTDEDERIYKEVRETIKSQTDEIKRLWLEAKQQNTLENMARKVREEQRDIYRKRIQGIRETNAIAIATARAKLFDARRKERQLRQIRMEKQKIANQIMKPVNLKTTDYDTSAKAIVAIQALIDPQFRRDWVYDISKNPGQFADLKGYGTMTIDEAKAYFNGLDDAQRMDISQYLSPSLLDRLTGQKKPLNDWTISELKDLASQVQALRDRGKLVLSAKKEAETARDNAIRKAIVNAIQNRIKSKGKTLPGSIERQKEQNKFSVKLQSWLYATYRPQELAQLLDGGFGYHGAAYRLLIDDKRYHQNREWRAVEKRLNKVDPLLTDKVIDQLVDTVTIDLGRGYSRTFTVDELAYVYLAKNDDSNHDAVAYGALMDEYEKGTRIADVEDPLTGENIRQFLFQNPELIVDDNELEQVGKDRFKKVYEVAKQELQDRGLMDVVKAISDDFNDAGNKERLNRASIEAYNVPLDARDYYLSIRRIDSKGDAIIDDAVNGILDVGTNTVIANPEGGFMITRKVIRPRNQGNIDLSLIGNWRRAVADQEHLIENAAYVKQLRSVFASRTSKEVARAIDQAYGTSLRKEIVDYIELIANPNKSEPKTNFDKAVKAFRGRTGAAYLGWKTSGIILQGITSPMPGLSEINPAKLTAAYLQIGAHPIETINMINEKSIFMKKRTMDMIVDEAIQRRSQWNQNRFQKIMNKQEEIGQIGLTLVDRYAVAGNWLAMYNMALQENLENGMDTAVAEAAAVQRADNFILRTQPVGDSTEMASMFRKGNELTKAVLQFQASLNVIWNTIVPDTIGFARNKEYGKIVGTMVGYAMAGVILGLVADGFDDDDDTKKKILKLSYWAITQQLSSVPLVSVSGIDGLVQKLITGKSEYSGVGVTIFPGVDKTVQAITAMSQGNWGKAASKAGEAAGIFLGAPTSAIKQYARAATGDWMALLGR